MAIVGVQEDLRYPDVVWVLLVRICIQLRMPGGDQGEALALLVVYGNVAQLQLLHRVRLYNDLPGVEGRQGLPGLLEGEDGFGLPSASKFRHTPVLSHA